MLKKMVFDGEKMQVGEDLLSISPKECAQVGSKDAVIYVWIKKKE